MSGLRRELPPLPERMKGLPVDERGYPVPWFVAYVNGKPDHRIADASKRGDAVRFKRCWVCGGPLGRYVTFVIGPMCGVNRVSSDPPSHEECAEWSAMGCPFLSRPNADRRDAGLPEGTTEGAGVMLPRNPGVTLLWTSRDSSTFRDGRAGFLFDIGNPIAVRWLAMGRPATRAEVEASVDSGLPALRAMCDGQPGAHAELDACVARLRPLLPEVAP